MSEDELELKEDIKNFQVSLKNQIKSFRKRIIEPGEIQILPKKLVNYTGEEIDAFNKDDLWVNAREYIYKQSCNLSLPLSSAKVFRFIHMRAFAQILELIDQACNRKNPIEICFHLRNYLEYSASFSYALDKIIPAAHQLSKNTKLDIRPSDVDPRFKTHRFTKKYNEYATKLYQLLVYFCFQTNVSATKVDRFALSTAIGDFVGNESLLPDKSFPLKSVNITKKLKSFEKKINKLHPTYDLLSEYLHPNSNILFSAISKESEQEGHVIIKDKKLEEGMFDMKYFLGEENQLFMEKITLEVLKGDTELLSLQLGISKKMKITIKKVLRRYKYKSDPTYSKAPCACGSKKKLINCCAN